MNTRNTMKSILGIMLIVCFVSNIAAYKEKTVKALTFSTTHTLVPTHERFTIPYKVDEAVLYCKAVKAPSGIDYALAVIVHPSIVLAPGEHYNVISVSRKTTNERILYKAYFHFASVNGSKLVVHPIERTEAQRLYERIRTLAQE